MLSNLFLLISLIAGSVCAALFKDGLKFLSTGFMNIVVLLLLFFMGAIIGNHDNLIAKLSDYGVTALLITVFGMFFSVLIVFIYAKINKIEK